MRWFAGRIKLRQDGGGPVIDDLERIRAFVKVVQMGSFSAAARQRSSTSTVARQVKSLEDEIGVRLINRNTRRLSLTEPGRRFFDRACTLISDLDNAKLDAKSFQQTVKGMLKVVAGITVGTSVVVPALPGLLRRYPELSIDLSLTDERVDLVANNIDVALWLGPIPEAYIAKRLRPLERVVCGSPKYLRRHGTPQSPEDLRRHNCLLFTARSYGSKWGFTKGNRDEEIEVQGNFRTDNGPALYAAALGDLGLIMTREYQVRASLAEGRLVRVLADYTVRPRPGDADLFMVYPDSRGLSQKVRVFLDFLVDLFSSSNPAEGSSVREGLKSR